MNIPLSFRAWYEVFENQVYRLGYTGPIDKDSFTSDFDEGKAPEIAAKEFVDEMND